jgi:hypothetical protein
MGDDGMSNRRMMPPRLKDWKEGTNQIGLFIRTKDGGVIEAVSNEATNEARLAAAELFLRLIEKKG